MPETASSKNIRNSVSAFTHVGQWETESSKRSRAIEVLIPTGASKSRIGEEYLRKLTEQLSKGELKEIKVPCHEEKKTDFKFHNHTYTFQSNVVSSPAVAVPLYFRPCPAGYHHFFLLKKAALAPREFNSQAANDCST